METSELFSEISSETGFAPRDYVKYYDVGCEFASYLLKKEEHIRRPAICSLKRASIHSWKYRPKRYFQIMKEFINVPEWYLIPLNKIPEKIKELAKH